MMVDDDILNAVYDKTGGHCHLRGRKVSFVNYGLTGRRDAWHVEHAVPKASGGTDHLNNHFPACIPCNLEKGIRTAWMVRRWKGRNRAPQSTVQTERMRIVNAIYLVIIGSGFGAMFGGKWALAGGVAGLAADSSLSVEEDG
jgi:hypothetical protein